MNKTKPTQLIAAIRRNCTAFYNMVYLDQTLLLEFHKVLLHHLLRLYDREVEQNLKHVCR